jgi:hypothetical protein
MLICVDMKNTAAIGKGILFPFWKECLHASTASYQELLDPIQAYWLLLVVSPCAQAPLPGSGFSVEGMRLGHWFRFSSAGQSLLLRKGGSKMEETCKKRVHDGVSNRDHKQRNEMHADCIHLGTKEKGNIGLWRAATIRRQYSHRRLVANNLYLTGFPFFDDLYLAASPLLHQYRMICYSDHELLDILTGDFVEGMPERFGSCDLDRFKLQSLCSHHLAYTVCLTDGLFTSQVRLSCL